MRRKAKGQRNPSNPGTKKAGGHPHGKYTANTMNGAIAPPTDEPLSKSAVANPRSLLGNHSDTALVAAGQFADSPAPRRNRNKAKLRRPRAKGVSIDTKE